MVSIVASMSKRVHHVLPVSAWVLSKSSDQIHALVVRLIGDSEMPVCL